MIDGLKQQFADFKRNGLRNIPGESVRVVHKKFVEHVIPHLVPRGGLSHEHINDVLVGLQLSSVPRFQGFFADEFNKQFRADAEDPFVGLGDGAWNLSQEDIRDKLVLLFDTAVQLFDKLSLEDKWRSVNGKELRYNTLGGPRPVGATCWNCGATGHSLRDCPKPRDEAKITAARESFVKQKKSKGAAAGAVAGAKDGGGVAGAAAGAKSGAMDAMKK